MKKLCANVITLGFAAVGLLACDGTTTPATTGRGGSTGAAGTTTGTAGSGTAGATGPVPGEGGASGVAGASAGMTGAAGDGAAGSSGQPDAGLGAGGASDAGTGSGGAGGHVGAAGGAGGSGGKAGATGAAGTTGAAGASAGASGSSFPARVTAPYVETWANISLTSLATATGNKFYTLAFVISRNGCTASWNGDTALSSNLYATDIANLRKMGGDVIISFGGASGVELGDACGTVDALQAAYQAVITKYGLKWMDLDIEGGAESNTTNVDRRNKALKNLKAANPGLRVAYTLAVDPSGLPGAQRNLLANAKSNGLDVDVVNVMAMDYGSCNLDMGKAATDAATATRAQLQKLGVAAAVGVTPMIGVNDTQCENFSTANATTLVDFANANDFVGLLAFWAVGADDSKHGYLNIFKAFK